MKNVKIQRFWQDENQTLGNCNVFDENNKPLFSAISLERGWQRNESNISCVPLGRYPLILEYSPKFKTYLWELKNVPNRSECKFHIANYWYQLNGCIALGNRINDINKDGYNDVLSSKSTLTSFHKALGQDTRAEIIIL